MSEMPSSPATGGKSRLFSKLANEAPPVVEATASASLSQVDYYFKHVYGQLRDNAGQPFEILSVDLLVLWDRLREGTMPDMKPLDKIDRIAAPALVVPATSMSVERLFSLAGCVLSVRRLAMKPQTRKELQIVAANVNIFNDNVERTGELCPPKAAFPWGKPGSFIAQGA